MINIVELNPYAPLPFVFTEVALCLRDSIQKAGYACRILQCQVEPEAALSIVLGASPGEPLVDRLDPQRTIVFNFEQLASNSVIVTQEKISWLRERMVFDYHASNFSALEVPGRAKKFFEIPIVPSPSLMFRPELVHQPSVDVLFFGSMNSRRTAIVNRLREAGLSVETISGRYGSALTPALLRARLVLNVHYYETRLFPALRMLQPVAQCLPIVSETSVFSPASDWSRSGILFAEYEELVDACQALLADPQDQLARIRRNQQFAAQLGFAPAFTGALNALGLLPG